jgi:hydroxymethylglutaryl-CoA lyase
MLGELDGIGEIARDCGARLIVGVACAFFAPARGPVTDAETDRVVDAAVDAGAGGVYLAGTSGVEHPGEFTAGITRVRRRHPALDIGVHLHNRNGFAMANALAAMAAGADWLEGSFAGLGGDLWFPGDPSVLGNAPVEDLVHLCAGMGIDTGVDLEAYLAVVDRVVTLTGRPATSFVTRGGTREQLARASWPG